MKAQPSRYPSLAATVLCALLPLHAVACGGDRATPRPADAGTTSASTTDSDPSAEDTLTVLYPGDERILSPIWDMPSKLLVFLPLVERSVDGELGGVLARSWEHSPDYRRWTIHLRTDVRWHDGEPFTARDVAFTYRLLQHPDVAWNPSGLLEVEAVDDSTVRFVYLPDARGQGTPLSTYQEIFPEHLLAEADPAKFGEWEFWVRPVGTGPFRYARHVPETMVELEANPAYYRGKPAIDRLILKFGTGTGSGIAELLAGNVDALGWAGRMDVLKVRGDDRFRSYYEPNFDVATAILWKVSDPRFRERSVRRAFTHAIDRRELLRVVNLPADLPIVDALPPPGHLRRRELPEPVEYDPDRARRLLTEAGWRDSDGDGVRERQGHELRFELLTPSEERQAVVFVQHQLSNVGVAADVRTLQINVTRDRWRNGDFEAILALVRAGRMGTMFGEESTLGFRHERAARLLRRMRATPSPRTRDSLWSELVPILRTQQPATFLFPQVHQIVAHRRVRGLSSPDRAYPHGGRAPVDRRVSPR